MKGVYNKANLKSEGDTPASNCNAQPRADNPKNNLASPC